MFHDPSCRRFPRRVLLKDLGMGATGLALAELLHRDRFAGASSVGAGFMPPDGTPHFAPKAKRVIWLFMVGGTSHLESFDPKPELNKYAGKEMGDTPYKAILESPFTKNVRIAVVNDANGHIRPKIYPLQVGYQKRGQSGIEVSDWFPHIGSCVDDLAVVRSMYTTNDNHGGQLQFHTGRHSLEGAFPTIGSWTHYGLGTENENLPSYGVLGTPLADCCGGQHGHGSDYLGPAHAGIRLNADPRNPLPFATPPGEVFREEQEKQFELLRRLNAHAVAEYPADDALRARVKSYELAFRMQAAVPETMRFEQES